MPIRQFGPYSVETSSLDKVLFPETGLTKGDLLNYYEQVAPVMVPHLKDRPLTMKRYPNGIDEAGFFQQKAADYFPDWITRVTVDKEGGQVTHAVCNNAATLVYLANQNVITPHVWLSRTDKLHYPDQLIFDLDPPGGDAESGSGAGFEPVREAAWAVKELLEANGLIAYVMTTGSSGLHVRVPIRRQYDFDTVRTYARAWARALVEQHNDILTLEQRKEKRDHRVFVDILRNAYGQTAVPPYAVRSRPAAPVATPLVWDELNDPALTPQRYTLRDVPERLAERGDPWHAMYRHARPLKQNF